MTYCEYCVRDYKYIKKHLKTKKHKKNVERANENKEETHKPDKCLLNILPKAVENIILDYKEQMELKLYKIELSDVDVEWDYINSMIICAANEEMARNMAADKCSNEGANAWLDEETSVIKLIALTARIDAGVVFVDYVSG